MSTRNRTGAPQAAQTELERENRRLRARVESLAADLDRRTRSLEDLDRLYRRTIENIADYAIFALDPDGTVASWNAGVERILGYTEDEFIGLDFGVIFTEEDRAAGVPEREMRVARSEERAEDDRWHVRKDGRRLWVNGQLAAQQDETGRSPGGFIKIMQDRTAQRERRLERERLVEELRELNATLDERVRERTAELRRSEAVFSKAFHAAHVATAIVTFDGGVVLDINRRACELLGVDDRLQALGRTVRSLGVFDQQPASFASGLRQQLAESGSATEVELRVGPPQGEMTDLLGSLDVIELEGRPCVLAMFQDISGRKRTEKEWMRAIEEVMQDASWFSRSVLEQVARLRSGGKSDALVADLTARERQVLILLATGFSNAAIAEELGLSAQTVRNYVSNTYSKLGVNSRADAVVWARDRGLVRF